MRAVRFVWLIAASLALVGCHREPALPAPDQESAVAFLQPATVKVIAFGDVTGKVPDTAYLRTTEATFGNSYYGGETESVIDAEFRKAQEDGTIAYGETFADFAWPKIAEHPEAYLFRDLTTDDVSLSGVPYAAGSGVVVSEDGVVLTCKHVIDDASAQQADFVIPQVQRVYEMLADKLGAEPSDAEFPQVAASLIAFMLEGAEIKVKFKEARVFFPLEWDGSTFKTSAKDPFAAFSLDETEDPAIKRLKNWTYACDVLAQGEPYPGKDVAVLRVQGVKGLVAAEMADEDAVQQGESLSALGFPGAAVFEGMTEEASWLAVFHSGKVGQVMPMQSGWRAIHFDADINHGDSGGPVFDSRGRLVGLSVAGKEDAPGQNLAVPVDVAQDMMREAGIEFGAGETTKKWREAVLLMQAQRQPDALKLLKDLVAVEKLTNGAFTISDDFVTSPGEVVPNRYLTDRLRRCQKAVDGRDGK